MDEYLYIPRFATDIKKTLRVLSCAFSTFDNENIKSYFLHVCGKLNSLEISITVSTTACGLEMLINTCITIR